MKSEGFFLRVLRDRIFSITATTFALICNGSNSSLATEMFVSPANLSILNGMLLRLSLMAGTMSLVKVPNATNYK